jgi:hypothetical protein
MAPADGVPVWFWPTLSIVVALPGVIGFWIFAVPVLKAYRMRRAGAKDDTGSTCPACGAGDLEEIAPQVFRCRGCGFVSGGGVEARRRQLRTEAMQRAPLDERIAVAAGDLREAKRALIAAQSLLSDAASRSKWDILGLSLDRGEDKQSSFGAAVRGMRNAEDLAKDAVEILKAAPWTGSVELDPSPLLLGLDTAWISDEWLGDVAMHLRIGRARKSAASLLERIEGLLVQLERHEPGARSLPM